MSPTEFDLRSALHDGEGHGPDPDAILAAGRARASARRGRLAAVTASVVGVLALGTVGAVALSHNGSDHPTQAAGRTSAAAGSVRAQESAVGALPPAGAGGSGPSASATASTAAGSIGTAGRCPTSFPASRPAGTGGADRSGSGDALFPRPVSSVVVCGYGTTSAGTGVTPGVEVLDSSAATRLVQSLQDAATSRPRVMCPDYRVADDHRLAFVGITENGIAEPAVFTTLGNPTCDVQVTNGSAVRYAWAPPQDLLVKLLAVTPR